VSGGAEEGEGGRYQRAGGVPDGHGDVEGLPVEEGVETVVHTGFDRVRRADELLLDGTGTTAARPAPAPGGQDVRGARELVDRLGAREREVSLAVVEGKTNAQIAAELYLSIPTVKAHLCHILTKLEQNNRVQIALLVYRVGLI
jgi:DNA-binding CsgD family transcriptional regulator